MIPSDVKQLVRDEIDRMFGGTEHVQFHTPSSPAGPPANPHFFQRFLTVMSAIQNTLDDLVRRLKTVEDKMAHLEWLLLTQPNERTGRPLPPSSPDPGRSV